MLFSKFKIQDKKYKTKQKSGILYLNVKNNIHKKSPLKCLKYKKYVFSQFSKGFNNFIYIFSWVWNKLGTFKHIILLLVCFTLFVYLELSNLTFSKCILLINLIYSTIKLLGVLVQKWDF